MEETKKPKDIMECYRFSADAKEIIELSKYINKYDMGIHFHWSVPEDYICSEYVPYVHTRIFLKFAENENDKITDKQKWRLKHTTNIGCFTKSLNKLSKKGASNIIKIADEHPNIDFNVE